MYKIATAQDFKKFLKDNKDKLLEKTVKIETLSPDDDWVNDNSWDEIYEKGEGKNGKI